jgi:hypothetical protein
VELLEAIVWNDDNLTYGSIISVYTGPDETITALTDDGVVKADRSFLISAGPKFPSLVEPGISRSEDRSSCVWEVCRGAFGAVAV